MFDLIVAWLLLPLLLGLVAFGIGLAGDRLSGGRIPGVLLLPLGIAGVIVVGQFAAVAEATAGLATPACIVLALAGYATSFRRREVRIDAAALAAAAAVYLVFAAPVLFSGDATFAGYIKLDDTATWFALTDQVTDSGTGGFEDLPISSYKRTLVENLGGGYPVGAFGPLGLGGAITGQDVAWVFQPLLALLAAALALAVYALLRPAIGSRWLAAGAAFIAAQAALLFAYAMWGAIKEIETAMLVALLAALALHAAAERRPAAAVPAGIAAAALLAVLGIGGGVWLAVVFAPALVFMVLTAGPRAALFATLVATGVAAGLSLPLVLSGEGFSPFQEGLTAETEVGNLAGPLSILHVLGIWPALDFRVDREAETVTAILLVVAALAAAGGLVYALARRQGGPAVYGTAALGGLVVILLVGSPWVDAKAMAVASPAVLALAFFGCAALGRAGPSVPAAILAGLIAFGVLWSTWLGYRGVSLAPREQLTELEQIGEEIDGEGPTLMTEYMTYGVRHFLREGDPEGASELRYRPIPLRDGSEVQKGGYADTDEFEINGLLTYRTLVLRRSPVQSRPPAQYRLVDSGKWYTVWQRPPGRPAPVLEHLPLGNVIDPGGVPACSEVRRLAGLLGPAGMLAAAPRAPVGVVNLGTFLAPADWRIPGDPNYLYPGSDGIARGAITTPTGGRHLAWVGGTLHGTMTLAVDARIVGAAEYHLNNFGQYIPLGAIDVGPGEHVAALGYEYNPIAPGGGEGGDAVGPLVLARDDIDAAVRYVPAARAEDLCGERWDWIEAIG